MHHDTFAWLATSQLQVVNKLACCMFMVKTCYLHADFMQVFSTSRNESANDKWQLDFNTDLFQPHKIGKFVAAC